MTTKTLSLLASLALALSLPAAAQQDTLPPQQQMTLGECIRYARRHSPQRISADVQAQQLEVQEWSAKMSFLPDLSAGVGENVSFGYTQGHDRVLRKNNGSSTGLSLSSSLLLFDGGSRWWALKSSQEALANKDYVLDEAEDRIALEVVNSYVNVLLAQQMVEIAKENLALSTLQEERIRTQVSAGKLPPSEQLKMRTQVGQDRLVLTQAASDLERAVHVLQLDMGVTRPDTAFTIPMEEPERIVARLDRETPYRVQPDWVTPSTRLAQLRYDLSAYDVKRARAGYFPKLSLSGGYSNGYYYYFGEEAAEALNKPFGDQLRSNGQYTIGLSLSIPLFTRGQVVAAVRQAELQRAGALGQLVQQQMADRRNITLASTDLRKAEEAYLLSRDNVSVAQEALEMTRKEYEGGRITAYEWEQAKNKLISAKSDYLRSVYNRLLRSINLSYYLSGTLPE